LHAINLDAFYYSKTIAMYCHFLCGDLMCSVCINYSTGTFQCYQLIIYLLKRHWCLDVHRERLAIIFDVVL